MGFKIREPLEVHPTKREQLGCREGWPARSPAQSKGMPSNAFVPMEIGITARSQARTQEKIGARNPERLQNSHEEWFRITPHPDEGRAQSSLTLLDQRDGRLRNLVEGGHCLRIGLKRTFCHDKVGELG